MFPECGVGMQKGERILFLEDFLFYKIDGHASARVGLNMSVG